MAGGAAPRRRPVRTATPGRGRDRPPAGRLRRLPVRHGRGFGSRMAAVLRFRGGLRSRLSLRVEASPVRALRSRRGLPRVRPRLLSRRR